MFKKLSLIYLVSLISLNYLNAQRCPNNGQNPSTAFPVCGTNTFYQASVPICSGQTVPSPSCSGALYEDKNPYYYKFTCFVAGSLNFYIDPNTNSDDYDWSLYDVTNRNPNDIYTDQSLTIASNWSGSGGNTGMSNLGNSFFICEGIGKPKYSKPVNLVVGHNYLLMVSHFTNSQSGYSLAFNGGTAVITDPALPILKTAKANCDGNEIALTINKKILCNSIASNGSDFYLTPNTAVNIVNATGLSCSNNFDADKIKITLSGILPAGNYYLHVKNGIDNNTLVDYCNNNIPLTDSIPFSFTPSIPTPIDSIAPIKCAPQEIKLVFKNKQIKCNSIASNGSDFSITGTYPVNVINATGSTCTNGNTDTIILKLDRQLFTKGNFRVTLQIGSDGNGIIDECNVASIIGSSKDFSIKDTVNADFTTIVKLGCVTDTILAFSSTANEINNWLWTINNLNANNNSPNPQFLFNQFGLKNINLKVSNGFCEDTSSTIINLDNYFEVDNEFNVDNCPNELIPFTNKSTGLRLNYMWQFGDGFNDTAKNPTHRYFDLGIDKTYFTTLIATNNLGCQKSVTKPINVLKLCGKYVPNAFTPNADGLNDNFRPLYAAQAINLSFKIYNRFGVEIFETANWRNGWDGKVKGVLQPSGVYIWTLKYKDRFNESIQQASGTVTLIR